MTATAARPSLNLDAIPAEIRAISQWVAWQAEQRDGKTTKVPCSASKGGHASSTAPKTWSSYALACKYQQVAHLQGVGFVVTPDDPYTGLDLDHVIDPETGEIEWMAREIIARMDSYSEVSPSGEGVRIFIRGSLPSNHCKFKRPDRPGSAVELYDHARFFTVTGRHIPGTPLTIEERSDELASLHAELMEACGVGEDTPLGVVDAPGSSLDDATLMEKASTATNGARFRQLWSGDTSGNGNDDSSADLALCNLLAFWTGGDLDQTDRLFRQSGLIRPKWDEQRGAVTYGELTLHTALDGCREFYTPRRAQLPAEDLSIIADDDPELVRRLRSQIGELQAQLVAKDQRIAELEESQSLLFQVWRNPHLTQGEKASAIASTFEYASAESRDLQDERGFVATPAVAIAEKTGASAKTVSAHLDRFAQWGAFEKGLQRTQVKLIDRKTGEFRYEPRQVTILRNPRPVNDTLRYFATLDPKAIDQERKSWGGARPACSEHPEAGTVKRWTIECAECGKVLDHGEQYTGPSSQDGNTVSVTETLREPIIMALAAEIPNPVIPSWVHGDSSPTEEKEPTTPVDIRLLSEQDGRTGGWIERPAAIVHHSAVFGTWETPVRSFQLGEVGSYAQYDRAVHIRFIEPRKRQRSGIWVYNDDADYVTIEDEGEVLYDSRADVPCDQAKWDEKAERMGKQRSAALASLSHSGMRLL
jgi:putative DNA primase/helicase